ncbi:MAG: hypothetical protein ACI399_00965 [Candidatus Cryptobacteroides sp.]
MKTFRTLVLLLAIVMASSCSKEGVLDNSIWMGTFTAEATNVETGEVASLPSVITILFSDDCNDVWLESGVIGDVIQQFKYAVNWETPLHRFTLHRKCGDNDPMFSGVVAGKVLYLTSLNGTTYTLDRQ